jgi:hypothetical protein
MDAVGRTEVMEAAATVVLFVGRCQILVDVTVVVTMGAVIANFETASPTGGDWAENRIE